MLLTGFTLSAQDNILVVAEKMPEYPGGTDSLTIYLLSHIRYPSQAFETGAAGKAFVKFVVDTGGNITSPQIIKTTGNKYLDEEALRVVKVMPKWNPGIDSGRKVNVSINLPIKFGGIVSYFPASSRPQGSGTDKSSNIAEKEFELPEEKPLSENQKKAVHYNDLGVAQARQERYEFALAKFDLSLKYDSTYRMALFNKAEVLLQLNQKQKACEVWKKYIALGYQSAKVDDLIKLNCN